MHPGGGYALLFSDMKFSLDEALRQRNSDISLKITWTHLRGTHYSAVDKSAIKMYAVYRFYIINRKASL